MHTVVLNKEADRLHLHSSCSIVKMLSYDHTLLRCSLFSSRM